MNLKRVMDLLHPGKMVPGERTPGLLPLAGFPEEPIRKLRFWRNYSAVRCQQVLV